VPKRTGKVIGRRFGVRWQTRRASAGLNVPSVCSAACPVRALCYYRGRISRCLARVERARGSSASVWAAGRRASVLVRRCRELARLRMERPRLRRRDDGFPSVRQSILQEANVADRADNVGAGAGRGPSACLALFGRWFGHRMVGCVVLRRGGGRVLS